MEDNNTQQKNMVMTAILGNPKMARTFRDAMSAPMGSTKRENAKSLLSIMKKASGIKADGMGGPGDVSIGGSNPMNSMGSLGISSNSSSTPDYSNMMIFPATPAFKKTAGITLPFTSNNSSLNITGSPSTSTPKSTTVLSNAFSTPKYNSITSNIKLPSNQPQTNTGLLSNNNSVMTTYPNLSSSNNQSPNNDSSGNDTTLTPGQFNNSPVLPNTGSSKSDIEALQISLNKQNAGQQGWTPLKVDGINGPKTQTAQNFKSGNIGTVGETPTTSTNTNPISNINTPASSAGNAFNIAATSIAKILGITPTTALAQIPVGTLAQAIATNEGYFDGSSKVAVENNNPGNLKFTGQAGAVQGPAASDGGYFAKFSTPEAGAQALMDDLNSKVSSGKYSTLNDLMTIYSPDSGNPSNTNSSSSSSGLAGDAAKAVAANTGPGLFALDQVNKQYGGSLGNYINDLDTKLRTQFHVDALEQQLTNLKAEKSDIIPTLTDYIKGKDQYSKAIDDMITQAQSQLLTTNMADPFTNKQYTDYMSYLYTLKGRQDARYGTYLNSAIADYNSDVDKVQAQYDTTYKNYTDALTRGSTLAQNDYNQLYTAMGDLYTSLDQAPIKLQNLETVRLQNLQNAHDQAAWNTDPNSPPMDTKSYAELKTLLDTHSLAKTATNPYGGLDTNTLGAGGLIDLFSFLQGTGLDPQNVKRVGSQGVNTMLADSLSANPNIAEVMKLKKLISGTDSSGNPIGLTSVNGGQDIANMISPSFIKSASPIMDTYITDNLSTIKDAAKSLVGGSGWFGSGTPGLKDKTGWKAKYSGLDSSILDNLYDIVNSSIVPGSTYEKDPSSFINLLLSGTPSNIASRITSTW